MSDSSALSFSFWATAAATWFAQTTWWRRSTTSVGKSLRPRSAASSCSMMFSCVPRPIFGKSDKPDLLLISPLNRTFFCDLNIIWKRHFSCYFCFGHDICICHFSYEERWSALNVTVNLGLTFDRSAPPLLLPCAVTCWSPHAASMLTKLEIQPLSFAHGMFSLSNLHPFFYSYSFPSHSAGSTYSIFSTNKMLTPWNQVPLYPLLLSRCQDGSGSGSGNVPPDQKFLLKWSVPLSFVEVLEFGSSEDMADSSRYPAAHSGEKVVINAKPSKKRSVSFCCLEWSHGLFVCLSVPLSASHHTELWK